MLMILTWAFDAAALALSCYSLYVSRCVLRRVKGK